MARKAERGDVGEEDVGPADGQGAQDLVVALAGKEGLPLQRGEQESEDEAGREVEEFVGFERGAEEREVAMGGDDAVFAGEQASEMEVEADEGDADGDDPGAVVFHAGFGESLAAEEVVEAEAGEELARGHRRMARRMAWAVGATSCWWVASAKMRWRSGLRADLRFSMESWTTTRPL